MKVVFDTNVLVSASGFADEPDSRILQCILTGRVEAIVTGDHALLELREYRGVRIISLRQYLGEERSSI